MIKIKKIANENSIHYFKLELNEDFHNNLIGFFGTLGFSDEELLKIDTPFSELTGEYVYLYNKKIKAHIFVEREHAHMVLDCKMPQKELTKRMKRHFAFPE